MSKRVSTVFRYRGASGVSAAALVGSWDEWTEQIPMKRDDIDETLWLLTKGLDPGHFTFKFVVDGTWTTGSEYAVEADGFGGENNVIDVVIPLKSAEIMEPEANGQMQTAHDDGSKLAKPEGKEEELKEEQGGCVVC